MLRASQEAGLQVVWDLCHYGWPDHIDIWSPDFVDRSARFAAAVASWCVIKRTACPSTRPSTRFRTGHGPAETGLCSISMRGVGCRAEGPAGARLDCCHRSNPRHRSRCPVRADRSRHQRHPEIAALPRRRRALPTGPVRAWDMLAGRNRPDSAKIPAVSTSSVSTTIPAISGSWVDEALSAAIRSTIRSGSCCWKLTGAMASRLSLRKPERREMSASLVPVRLRRGLRGT